MSPWLDQLDQLRFAQPWFLLVAAAALPLAAAALVADRRAAPALRVPSATPFASGRRGWALRLRHLPLAAEILALVFAGVALARPQLGAAESETVSEGIDILLVLDVSGSMAAEDFRPHNRLEVAKKVAADFVRQRRGDRIGLVVFAGKSLARAPLTTDSGMLLGLIESLALDELPDGTAIGMAIASGVTRLQHASGKSRVMVLVTDGINNAGPVEPQTAAGIAAAMNMRIHTVGVGSDGPVPVPIKHQDPFTGAITREYRRIELPIDERGLRRIADSTGGRYFRAGDAAGLAEVFAAIDALEKTSVKVKEYTHYRELYQPVAAAAVALLVAAALLASGRLQVLP